jgi:RecB family exonuclease
MLAQGAGLAFTPGYGLPLAQLPAAEGFLCLLDWAGRGQSAGLLAAGLRRRALKPPAGAEESLSPHELARALEDLSLGFGASRYEPALLRALAVRYQEREKKEIPAKTLLAVELLAAELLTGLPQGPRLSLAGLACWLRARALKLVALPVGETGQGHYRGLLYALSELAQGAAGAPELEANAAVELLRAELALRIQPAQAPKPGCVHLSRLESGAVAFRPHILLLGLDESRFPGSPVPDPFLSAPELKALGLATPEDRIQARLLSVLQALADLGRPQSLAVGFCRHEVAANREKAPSGLGLQIFRLKQPGSGYDDYLKACGEPAGLAPRRAEDSLDPMELGLCLGLQGRGDAAALVDRRMAQGLAALEARRQPSLGGYDSLLAPGRVNLQEQRWSASQLKNFLGCPRKWLYEKVLRLRAVEAQKDAASAWLEPNDEGTLVHAFLEWHQGQALAAGKNPTAAECAARMETLIAKARLDHAQPGAGVAKPQEEALRKAAGTYPAFLERALEPGWKPEATELELATAQGQPLELALPAGLRIRVSGFIDYAESKDGQWRVWDYKTGSAKEYAADKIEKNGPQLLVYLAGLKAWLRERHRAGQVVEAGYLFPSQKGGYQRLAFAVDAAQAEDLLEAMLAEPLRNAFEKGCFAPLEKTDCHYCGFKAACDMEAIKARVKAGKGGA